MFHQVSDELFTLDYFSCYNLKALVIDRACLELFFLGLIRLFFQFGLIFRNLGQNEGGEITFSC